MNDDTIEIESGSDTLRVYEVGYLLLPSIPEEQVPDKVSQIKQYIEEGEGKVLVSENPKLRPLAYDIEKHIATRNEHFHTAYFGWIKFECSPSSAVALKTKLDAMGEMLRFILIKSSLDVIVPPKPIAIEPEIIVAEGAEDIIPTLSLTSEQEIDKSIEELVRE
jgi:ribosomal protein S6